MEGFTFTVNVHAGYRLATGSGFNSRIYIREQRLSRYRGFLKGNLTIGTNAATHNQ